MKIAGAAAMRAMDAEAIAGGISSLALMERAAGAAADETLRRMGRPGRVAVFCGSGNNGGDGVAAARLLRRRGCFVRCFLTGSREKMTADTAEMERRLIAEGGALEPYDDEAARESLRDSAAAVDALFGTGLHAPLRGSALLAVRAMNESGVPVIACDLPSGVGADTGEVFGEAVRAAATVTFSMPKPGLLLPPGWTLAGDLLVADIGIPPEIQARTEAIGTYVTRDFVRARLPKRPRDAHKGDFGKVLLLCGSRGLTGAAAIAAKAALRAGAGMLSLGVPEPVYPILASKLDECMTFPLPSDEEGKLSDAALPEIFRRLAACDACLIGPGLGRSEALDRTVEAVVRAAKVPLVVDADGINALAGHIDILRGTAGSIVLTPHDGEFARLGGDMQSDRFASTAALAERTGCTVVRKGYRTVTASDGELYVNSTGNPGMAKGGSGDALSGILLALLGQGMAPADAAACAVWIHGAAGDACAARLGEAGCTPGDLISAVPSILK